MIAVCIAAVCIAFATGACGTGEHVVRGRILIDAPNGSSAAIDSATVELIPEAVMLRHLDSRRAMVRERRATLDPEMGFALNEMASAYSRLRAAKDSLSEPASPAQLQDDLFSGGITSEEFNAGRSRPQTRRQVARINAARDTLVLRRATLDSLKAISARLDSGEYFMEDRPPSIATATTDTNGEFTLRVPRRGRAVIAAYAHREAMGANRAYTWIVRIPNDARGEAKLLLHEQNSTRGTSPLSLVKTSR